MSDVLSRLYPFDYLLNKDGVNSVNGILEEFKVGNKFDKTRNVSVKPTPDKSLVTFAVNGHHTSIQVFISIFFYTVKCFHLSIFLRDY